MHLRILLVVLMAGLVYPFQVGPTKQSSRVRLDMSFFDFDKFTGSGSASKQDLDEMWETQQAILRERQGHGSKTRLKKKYKTPTSGGPNLIASKPKQSSMNEIRIEKTQQHQKKNSGFKLPWEK